MACDFLLGELTQLYPNVNIEICRHFVLARKLPAGATLDPAEDSLSVDTSTDSDNVSQLNHDSNVSKSCLLCDLTLNCEENSQICMRCKCINNRIDQLSSDFQRIQHAVEAILDRPGQDPSSTSHPHATFQTTNAKTGASRSSTPNTVQPMAKPTSSDSMIPQRHQNLLFTDHSFRQHSRLQHGRQPAQQIRPNPLCQILALATLFGG